MKGNLIGTTVVTRETEWNKYAQDTALALEVDESRRCPQCHNLDALVSLEADRRFVDWPQHDGRRVEVAAFRCVFCGAADLVKRDAAKDHHNEKPIAGTAFWADGRIYAARPPTEEVT